MGKSLNNIDFLIEQMFEKHDYLYLVFNRGFM